MEVTVVSHLPASGSGRYERAPRRDHMNVVRRLKREPEVWVMVKASHSVSNAAQFARAIRESKFIAFQDGNYEAVIRKAEVWARYMGPKV